MHYVAWYPTCAGELTANSVAQDCDIKHKIIKRGVESLAGSRCETPEVVIGIQNLSGLAI